jgi:hypothetical protein
MLYSTLHSRISHTPMIYTACSHFVAMSTDTYMILTVYYLLYMLSSCMLTQPTIDLRLDHTCTLFTLGWDSSVYLD